MTSIKPWEPDPDQPLLSIKSKGKTLLVMHKDGTVAGSIEDAGEAAKIFLKTLREHYGVNF